MATPRISSSLDGSNPSGRVTVKAGWPVAALDPAALDPAALPLALPAWNGRFGGFSQRSNHCSVSASTRLVS